MKHLCIAIALSAILTCPVSQGICDRLDDAGRSADNAYDYASKAPNTRNLPDAKYRSREVVGASADARDSAMSARAYGAADAESRAYDYSRKAVSAANSRDAQFYAKQAEKAAADASYQIDTDIYKKKQEEKYKTKGY